MRRVLALLLDAASPDLIERWTDDGTLPNLKRLREGGAYGRVDSVAEWLAEATPYALFTGRNPAATGLHFYSMWRKEAMRVEPPCQEWLPYQPFWRAFDRNGPRAIVLDPPNVYAPEPFNGIEIVGWGSSDTLVPFQAFPRDVAARVRRRYGAALMPDEFYGLVSKRDFFSLRERLLRINHRFRDLCLELLKQEAWDLFLATNFTLHYGGHRLWNSANVSEVLSREEQAELNDSLRRIYVAADDAVGHLVRAAGDQATVLVFSVHGMGINNSRSWVLSEMLGRVLGTPAPSGGILEHLRRAMPLRWRHSVKSRLPYAARRALTRRWRRRPYTWEATRAFSLFSDTQGWIRINLKGREAQGIVEPGDEYETLCTAITEGLKTFADADTGAPIVKDIGRPPQIFKGSHADDLPDIVVRWEDTPSNLHRALVSARFGTVDWPTPGRNPEGRSGNHRPQGMLIACGPGIRRGSVHGAHLLDVAPTILSLLGQAVPRNMEGTPLPLADLTETQGNAPWQTALP